MVAMADDSKQLPTSVRLDADIRGRLEEFAKRDRRSLSSAVNYLLGSALDQEEKNEKGASQ